MSGRANPLRAVPSGRTHRRADEDQRQARILNRHQSQQSHPVVVAPILALNLAAGVDSDKSFANKRRQTVIGGRGFAGLQAQVPKFAVVEIDRSERCKTPCEAHGLVFGFSCLRVDPRSAQIAPDLCTDDMPDSTQPEKAEIAQRTQRYCDRQCR